MSYVMQVDIIASEERGITETDWLLSKHTYSFGGYHNMRRLNFGTLRVFNDDVIQGGKGFGMHAHENMEIVTIVLEGELEHRDNKGNQGILIPGDVQRMTAGTGIRHSEYNASKENPLRLLQIWVYPNQRDLEPGYEQKKLLFEKNILKQIVTPEGSESALSVHQDAQFFLGEFDAEKSVQHTIKSRKHGVFIFVIGGKLALGDKVLQKGDSAQITQIETLEMQTLEPTKMVLIEVGLSTL